jgi:hypothetical protein
MRSAVGRLEGEAGRRHKAGYEFSLPKCRSELTLSKLAAKACEMQYYFLEPRNQLQCKGFTPTYRFPRNGARSEAHHEG